MIKKIISKNGLDLIEINSKVFINSENGIDDIGSYIAENFPEDGFFVYYLTNRLLIGQYISGKFHSYGEGKIDKEFLLKLRVFNQRREVLLWRSREKIFGRTRIDDDGEGTYAVDAYQQLWGTDYKNLEGGFTKIFEERGTELILPFSDLKVDNKQSRIFIKTRNYVDFHPENHLATYVDCRFIGFYDHEKKLLT